MRYKLPDAPPPAGMKEWFGHDFDDSKWKEGNAIFGIWKKARGWLGNKTISTEWNSDYIFLRKSFQLEDVQKRCPHKSRNNQTWKRSIKINEESEK